MHPSRRFQGLQFRGHTEVMERALAGMPLLTWHRFPPHGMRLLWAMIPHRLWYPDVQGPEASRGGRPRPPFLIGLATMIPWHLMVAATTCPWYVP